MSSRKYNTNDNDLIWESFQQRTNHKMAQQNSKYDELLENDLKYIEEFLIREGIWDKVKGAAGAAAGKVKDFAAEKIMKPVMDMLVAAMQKDPASAEKLPELQQAAQGGGDIKGILQANGDQSIMKQLEAQPDAADPEAGAAPQAESYLYQFNMNSMICEALVDQGIISESKSQIIQERYYVGAIGTLFNEANKPKDCPWMPSTAQQVNESNVQAVINQIDAIARTGGAKPKKIWPGLLKKNKGFQNFIAIQKAAAVTEAPTEESPGPEGAPEDGTEAPPGTPEAPETETVPFVSAANPGDPHPSLPNIVFVKAAPPPNPDGHGVFAPAEGFEWVDPDDTSAGAKPKDEVETPEEDAPQPMSAGDENTPTETSTETSTETPTETPESDPQSQIQNLQGQLKDDDPDTPDEIAQMKAQIAQLTAQLNGGKDAGAGPAAPTVGAGGASMPAKPVADGATPAGGAPAPVDGAKAPGILGKVWSFLKDNKGAIGGLAAMGIAAALTGGVGPVATLASTYLSGALIGGTMGAIKGARATEGGFMDKLKGAANQAGTSSMKAGGVAAVAGAIGQGVGGINANAANAATDGQIPSVGAEPYVAPSVEPGVEPEVPEDLPTSSIDTPWDPDSQGGEMSDEEWANLPSQGGTNYDPETGAAMPTDANGETPGVDYQEPDAQSAAEAEAGVGTIDPVTGKPIEMIDPENKPGFFKKLGSLLPGGVKPREVFGSNTGRG
jgi:hypothetical protein